MKIYNRIVFNIETREVLEEDSYEYEGEIALCGPSGGGETTVTTMIPEKTIEEHNLDKMQLQLMQAQYPVQLELLKYQKQAAEYQQKVLPQILATQEKLLPLQEQEAAFYLDYMPEMMKLSTKQLELASSQATTQAELQPLQKEIATLQLEQAKKALAGEPLATEKQKKTLRTMTDQFVEKTISGLKNIEGTLYEKAIQKGLAIGMPFSDIAESFKGTERKYLAEQATQAVLEGERMYTAGLTNYPTAMAEFAQRISQAPGSYSTTPQVSSGGYALPAMNQIGGVAQMPTSSGGLESLNQMLAQLRGERYGMGTQTQNMPGITAGQRGARTATGALGGAATGAMITGPTMNPWIIGTGALIGATAGYYS